MTNDDEERAADTCDVSTATVSTHLVPIAADTVKPGDLIRPNINEWLRVESVETTELAQDRAGGPLLKFQGRMLESPFGNDFPSSHLAYADEWVVVER